MIPEASSYCVKKIPNEPVWELLRNGILEQTLYEHGRREWELRDPALKSYHPPRGICLGSALDGIGESWPSQEALADQAQQIVQQSQSFRQGLRNALPWIPELIVQMYPDSPEYRARLALLFWHVVRILNDPFLTTTQARLEQLAYHSLCDVYEKESRGRKRFQAVQQAWRQAFRTWYATIADPNRTWLFEPDAAEQRETAMWEALTFESDEGRRLWRFFRETSSGRETVRRLIERWFLPRYDLDRAEQLKVAVQSAAQDSEEGGWLRDPPWLGARGLWLSRSLTLATMIAYFVTSFQPLYDYLVRHMWTPPAWLIMLAIYVICGLPFLLVWLTAGRPDTSVPRLWAGILVAVVGTILQQNWGAMMAFAHAKVIALVVLCAFFLLAAYRVLLVKVRQATGFEASVVGAGGLHTAWRRLINARRDPAHRRCAAVWLRGLTLAFVISLLLTDLLGDGYLQTASAAVGTSCLVWRLPGLIGHTYPALAMLFTALALFASVFVQLLWEEKPITEGLA